MRKNFYLLILLIFLKGACFAGDEGTSAVPFLKIPVGARAAAIGGSFTAISDDASGIFSNAAGLSLMEYKELLFAHNQWIEGISGEAVAYVYPLSSKFSLGVGANILLSGAMKKYDITGTKTGEFNYSEGALVAAISGKVLPRGSIGLGIKTIYQKSGDKNVMVHAADIGVMSEFKEKFRFGLNIENIGSKIKLDEEGFPVPLGIKAGIAYMPFKYGFITGQIKKYSDEDMKISVGSEYGFDIGRGEAGFLRGGYALDSENIASGINFGFGLSAGNFLIDYAFAPMGDFGAAHRISLRIVFKAKDDKKREDWRKSDNDNDNDDFFGW